MLVNIQTLIDDAKCYEVVRQLRWPTGVQMSGLWQLLRYRETRAPHPSGPIANGMSARTCGRQFDDLSGTIFEGHHQPLRVWVLCLYFMGLNLSNEQIAAELEVDADTVQVMATQLREGVVVKKSPSA